MEDDESVPDKETYRIWKKDFHRDLFERVSEGVVVKEPLVKPPPAIVEQEPWDSLVSHPQFRLREGRNFIAKVDRDGKKKKWRLHAVQGNEVRKFTKLNFDQFDYDESLYICNRLVWCLKRWPNMDDISSLERYSSSSFGNLGVLFRAAVCKVFPDKPIVSERPCVWKGARSKGGVGVKVKHCFIDLESDTMNLGTFTKTFDAKTIMNQDKPIPMPENIAWRHTNSLHGDPNTPLRAEEEGLDQTFVRLEKLARYEAAYILRHSPLVTTRAILEKTVLHVEQRFARNSRHILQRKEYDGHELIVSRVHAKSRSIRLNPSQAILHNVPFEFDYMLLGSLNRAWVQIVFDAASKEWQRNGDILGTWRTIAATVDEVNEKIFNNEPSPDQCDCAPTATGTGNHSCFCGMCGGPTVCEDLRDHCMGYRACGFCRRERVISPSAWASAVAKVSITKSIRDEAEAGGWDEDKTSRAVEECLAPLHSLIKTREGSIYWDIYCSRWRRYSPQVSHPELLSVDTIFPFCLDSAGEVRCHYPGNLASTSAALNYAKKDKPPIALKWIGEYTNKARILEPKTQRGGVETEQQLRGLQWELVEKFRRLLYVTRKVPLDTNIRLRVKFPEGAAEYLYEEFRSGRPHRDPEEPVKAHRIPLDWPLPDWLWPRIDEIEEWTGHRLPRKHDCPYFLHEATMPDHWNWGTLYGLMSQRLRGMKKWCNNQWDTDDTQWTLILEGILQACLRWMVVRDTDPDRHRKRMMQEKYADLLHLPLTSDYRCPLSFALAKVRHHEKMWSGWEVEPKSLEERLQANDRGNIIFEAQVTNYLRNDHSDGFKPLLKQMILDIDMPKELADEDLVMGEYDEALERKLSEAVSTAKSEVEKLRKRN